MSATPGQKKKAYAQAFPANVTKLWGAVRKDNISVMNSI